MTDGEHSFNAGLGTVRNVVDKVLGSHHVQRPMEIPDPPIFPLPCLCIKGYPGMLTFLFLEYLALSRKPILTGRNRSFSKATHTIPTVYPSNL